MSSPRTSALRRGFFIAVGGYACKPAKGKQPNTPERITHNNIKQTDRESSVGFLFVGKARA